MIKAHNWGIKEITGCLESHYYFSTIIIPHHRHVHVPRYDKNSIGAHLEYMTPPKLFLLKAGNMVENLDLHLLSNARYVSTSAFSF